MPEETLHNITSWHNNSEGVCVYRVCRPKNDDDFLHHPSSYFRLLHHVHKFVAVRVRARVQLLALSGDFYWCD